MSNYIIAGGAGFVGTALSELLLEEGHQVYVLSTKPRKSSHRNLTYVLWDTKQKTIDSTFSIKEAKLVNLAGAGVADKRWTTNRKAEILHSRLDSLQTLYNAIESGQLGITHMVSASAIGYYAQGTQPYTEESPSDESYLSTTCVRWEEAAKAIENLDVSVSIARIGIVMGLQGGALRELSKSLSYRIAGIPSDGRQIYSWIHLKDVCRLLYFLAENEKKGIFNAVAPEPVSLNRLFEAMIATQGKSVLRLHVPAFILKIILGEMAIEILKSSEVNASKILQSGFIFNFNDIESCMKDLLGHHHSVNND